MRKALLTIGFSMLGCFASGSETFTPNSPDEPLAKEFSLVKASEFLNKQTQAWLDQRRCLACHTVPVYLMSRSMLAKEDAGLNSIRTFVETQIGKNFIEDGKTTAVVRIAAAMAMDDAFKGGKLQTATRKALDAMWVRQQESGAVEGTNGKFHTPYSTSLFAAIGTGYAPDNYAREAHVQPGLEKLKGFLKKNDAANLHDAALLLWASIKIEGLMSRDEQAKLIQEIKSRQQHDGSWSSDALTSKVQAEARVRYREKAEGQKGHSSDGDPYATGLFVFVLRLAGVEAADDSIQRAIRWIKSNQRESGRWFSESGTTNIRTHIATNYVVMALKSCEP